MRTIRLSSLALVGLLMTASSLKADLYEWAFTGKIASRVVYADDSGNTLRSTFDSTFPNGLDFEIRFLVDTAKATSFTGGSGTMNYQNLDAATPFISQGSLRIGSVGSPVYEASFSSLVTGTGPGYQYHSSFTVRNNEYTGTTGGGAPIYIDGININFNNLAIQGTNIGGGAYYLESINIALATPGDGVIADPLAFDDLDIPTDVDSTLFEYRSSAFNMIFRSEALDEFNADDSGYVGGGLGGTPGALLNPSFPAWGTVGINSFSITAVPEPAAAVLFVGMAALTGAIMRRRRRN